MHIRLYAKPTPLACSLAIAGPIEPFRVGALYEGRLNVSGQAGDVQIVDWSGNLPAGSEVSFDAVNSQIVVTWPQLQEVVEHVVTVDATNKDFEQGDGGWSLGNGVTITNTGDAFDGTWSAQFANAGGLSEIASKTLVPVTAGQSVTATAQFQQGASSSGNLSGRIVLNWFDAGKQAIDSDAGNTVNSGSNAAWHPSSVTASAPVDGYVQLGFSFNRERQNRPCWVDAFSWNAAAQVNVGSHTVGYDREDPLDFAVTVRDGKGCVATWSGQIKEYAIYLTSQLYPLYIEEGEADAPLVTGGSVGNIRTGALQQSDEDSPLVSGGSVQVLNLVVTVAYSTHNQPQDDADSPLVTGGSVQALSRAVVVSYSTYAHAPDDTDSPLVTGGSVQALSMVVTIGYQTYDWTQDDADSPLVTGGSVTNLSITHV